MLATRRWPLNLLTITRSLSSVSLLLLIVQPLAAAEAKQRVLPDIGVSVSRRLCETPFSLKLACPVDGAAIRYTADGTEPTWANGNEYSDSLLITNSTVLRAAAFKNRARVSSITTHSYIFLEQVKYQPKNPPGFPAGPTAWKGQPSAYEMNPQVVDDGLYRDHMIESLRSLPILSVVCRKEDLFDRRTGLYVNSLQRGETWERPCSVELILADGSPGFQIDCGLRIQGNYNRIPVKSPKHSFRLLFKEKYGASKLHYPLFPDSPVTKFDTLVLRADYNNSWIHWEPTGRARAQRTRDAWMKDSHRAMGWTAGHNRFLHLFLDGLYWGVYDAAERPDASFAASYFGGQRQHYDVINEFQVKDGNIDGFNALNAIRGLARNSQYEKLRQHLDITQYIDYLLLNYYAGNQDWGENKNWYAIARHEPPGPFQYFVWDGEHVLQQLNDDTVNAPFEVPFRLAQELRSNAEFRLAFADRAQKHLFNDGALTPAAAVARWMQRATEIDRAIISESARWGGYRRDPPYTRDLDWMAEQRRLLKSYFPRRTGIFLEQLRAAGLYPQIPAPVFFRSEGGVDGVVELSMSSAGAGCIYFTTNGVDPRVYGSGAVSPDAIAYANPLAIHAALQVKARVWKDATWSALVDATVTNSLTRGVK
jgi:CotH kinase protein/Chitobiase/beta-hexosaminidase C-terminal domain